MKVMLVGWNMHPPSSISVPIGHKILCTRLLKVSKSTDPILQCVVLDCITADDEVWSYVNGHVHKVMSCKFHVFAFSEVLNVASYKLGNNVISNIFGVVETFNERLPIHIWIRKFTCSMQTFSKFLTPFGHERQQHQSDHT
jgi:hypothetical protein